ncbi:thioredoxin domain-containing protein [Rhodobacteraceae bacterium Araon29]
MTQHKTAFASILCLLLFTQMAAAFDVSKMTENQRVAFRAEIRAYLLDNPEVIYEAVDILQQRQAQTETQRDLELVENNSAAIFADGYSYVGGNPEGDITLVEFVDYKCGYCRKAHSEVEELLARDGNIKLIIKEFPILGESSITSAQFAIAVQQLYGNKAYKAAHDILISFKGNTTPSALGRIATALNLDKDSILNHMNTDSVIAVIQQNRALGQIMEITGTPTFVLHDEILRGFVPADALVKMVTDKRR